MNREALENLARDPSSLSNEEIVSLSKDIAALTDKVLKGETTLQIELGLSDDEMEAIYTVAYSQYMAGRYSDARKMFAFLLMLNPLEYKYSFALGSCSRMLKKYDEASIFYFIASMLSDDNPEPLIFLAESLIYLDDKVGAKENLERAEKMIAEKKLDDYKPLVKRVKMMLEKA